MKVKNSANIPTFFIIEDIEAGWSKQDLEIDGMEWEYCDGALDIPTEYIEEVKYREDGGLEIILKDVEDVIDEDWYTQLLRKSSYYN